MYRVQEVVAGKHVVRGYFRTVDGAAEKVRRIIGGPMSQRAAERLVAGYRLPIEVTGLTGDIQAVIVPLQRDAERVYTLHGRRAIRSFRVYHPLIGEAFTPAEAVAKVVEYGWREPEAAAVAELLVGNVRGVSLINAKGERTGFIRAWEVV